MAKEVGRITPYILKNASTDFVGRSSEVFAGLEPLEQRHISYQQNLQEADILQQEDELEEESLSGNKECEHEQSDHHKKRKLTLSSAEVKSSCQQGEEFSSKSRDSPSDSHQEGVSQPHTLPGQANKPDFEFRKPIKRAAGRYSRVPDHRKHPENWTYYSLEGVMESHMSEKSNTQAAMAFLKEQVEQAGKSRTQPFDVQAAACSKGLFSFAKTSKHANLHSEKLARMETVECDSAAGKTNTAAEMSSRKQRKMKEEMEKELDEEKKEEDDGTESSSPTTQPAAVSHTESACPITQPEQREGKKTAFKSRKEIRRNIRSRDDVNVQ